MRYSSAVVLSTLAVGGAAAAHHGRHANFHARRQAEAKRSPDGAVNWGAVAYDLKSVDWSKVNWSSVFASTPAATPTPTPTPSSKAQPTPTPEVKKPAPSSSAAPAPSSAAPAPASSSSAAATVQAQSTNSGSVSGVVSNVVAKVASALGAKTGLNSQTNNGGIWIGTDSAWQMHVTNSGSESAVWWCWRANGFSGMSINANTPDISVGIDPGNTVKLSFAANVPAACASAGLNSKLALFGGVDNTWAEVTFGQYGAFDVSRNVNMQGSSVSMVGSKCTSDMNQCVFKCKDSSVSSCEKGTDYDLFNCSAGNGGGGGYDVVMQGTGGGCAMGSSGETIKVSFS